MVGYSYSMANFKVPDQPVDPPEFTDEELDIVERNWCREEAIEALGTAIGRLVEVDCDNETIIYLNDLQTRLYAEMEG